MKQQRILMMIHDISPNGMAKLFFTLLHNLIDKPYELHLAITVDCDNEMADLPSGVKIHRMKKTRALAAVIPTKQLLNQLKPDIVLSGSWNLNLLLAFLKPRLQFPLRLILCEGSVASQSQVRMKWKSFHHWLCRLLYPRAEVILGVSDYVCFDLKTRVGIPAAKLRRIYGAVDVDSIEIQSQEGISPFLQYGNGPHVVMVGRICAVKNHPAVIASFPRFLQLHPNGHLWILGAGILREELLSLIEQLKLTDHVHLVGVQHNPFIWLKHADLFALPSLKEGFPNVLLEAIACGCPVVSTCTTGGVPELLKLCRIEDRLIDQWDWPAQWLERPRPETKELLRHHFGVATVIEQYEQLFRSI